MQSAAPSNGATATRPIFALPANKDRLNVENGFRGDGRSLTIAARALRATLKPFARPDRMRRRPAAMLVLLLSLGACARPASDAEAVTAAEQSRNAEQIAKAEDAGQLTPAEQAAHAAARSSGDDAPYYTKLPLSEFMPHVMQYAGDGIWKHQGYISNKDGLHSLFPKNDQEWEEAESGARALAEITNVLLIPGRRVPDPEWDKAVLGVRKVALQAADAAEKHDAERFFKAGGDLDEACDACHRRFDPKFKPDAAR